MIEIRQFDFADGEQVAIDIEGTHVLCAFGYAEGRDPEVASLADLRGRDLIYHFGRKLWQQLPGGHQRFGKAPFPGEGFEVC